MAFIEFRDVYKKYKMGEVSINAADGVNFEVEQGEFCLIIGASGAGKTTVLNMLGGIDKCTDGRIRVDGDLITSFDEKQLVEYRRRDVGFVFQFYNLVPTLTALENVELASQLTENGVDPVRMLSKVGLGERMINFPSQLSGGEQQRTSIARALAKNPKLLLCDEPTGALDYVTGKQILKLLQETCHETGMTIVVITHNQALAPMADRIITMRSGRVTQIAVNDTPLPVDSIEW